MTPFGTAILAADMTALAGLLHPDATFTSPAVFEPYRGRAAVLRVLTAATQTIEDFAYTGETHGPGRRRPDHRRHRDGAPAPRARGAGRCHAADAGPAAGALRHMIMAGGRR